MEGRTQAGLNGGSHVVAQWENTFLWSIGFWWIEVAVFPNSLSAGGLLCGAAVDLALYLRLPTCLVHTLGALSLGQ